MSYAAATCASSTIGAPIRIPLIALPYSRGAMSTAASGIVERGLPVPPLPRGSQAELGETPSARTSPSSVPRPLETPPRDFAHTVFIPYTGINPYIGFGIPHAGQMP